MMYKMKLQLVGEQKEQVYKTRPESYAYSFQTPHSWLT